MNKYLFGIILILLALISVASVCATPDIGSSNQNLNLTSDCGNDILTISNIDLNNKNILAQDNVDLSKANSALSKTDLTKNSKSDLSIKNDADLSKKKESALYANNNQIGSFSDLNKEMKSIKTDSVYNFTRDYKYNDGDNTFRTGIDIKSRNIIIYGNGHVIDGSGMAGIFNVKADSVSIYNLTFINSGYINTVSSGKNININGYTALNWYGNYGYVKNCVFKNTTGLNGGAISWNGKDGEIFGISISNSTASGVGGGIYLGGNNNLVKNVNFEDCDSLMTFDSIYIDGKTRYNRIFEIEYDSLIGVLDGSEIDIDPSYLNHGCNITVADKSFNVVPLLFYLITHDLPYYSFNDTKIFLDYSSETKDFVMSIYKDYSNGFSYKKVFHLSKANSLNDILDGFINGKFTNELTFIKHLNITSVADYEKAINYNRDDLYNDPMMKNFILDFWYSPAESMVYGLDLKFIKPITINTHAKWNTTNNRLDVININGNGSKIYIENHESDEYHWASIAPNCILSVENLSIQGYNTAIEILGGYCILNNVILDGNRINYSIQRDWGGAILNAGYCLCNNCTFSNNYAKNGGAIFNQGLLQINNCTFTNNQAYGKGNDVFSADDAIVMLDGERIENSQGIITHANSLSSTERTVLKISSYVASFCIGFLVGFFTANPVIGTLAGAAVGGAIGSLTSAYIIKYTYDINFNRFATAFEIISTSISVGMIGGGIGGSLGKICKESFRRVSFTTRIVNDPKGYQNFLEKIAKINSECLAPGITIKDGYLYIDHDKLFSLPKEMWPDAIIPLDEALKYQEFMFKRLADMQEIWITPKA